MEGKDSVYYQYCIVKAMNRKLIQPLPLKQSSALSRYEEVEFVSYEEHIQKIEDEKQKEQERNDRIRKFEMEFAMREIVAMKIHKANKWM